MLQELAAAQIQDARRRADMSRIGRETKRRSRPAPTGRTPVLRRMSQLMHPAAVAQEPIPRRDGGRPTRPDLSGGPLTRSTDPREGWRVVPGIRRREAATAEAQPRR